MLQKTLAIIKPDAVKKNVIGKIVAKIENENLKIVAMKMAHLSESEAKGFYDVHKDRPFFMDLVKFMISGPVVIMVLEGEDAVVKYRNLMGATNPQNADEGTIRKEFADSIEVNAVHGSDSVENASIEVKYFFGV